MNISDSGSGSGDASNLTPVMPPGSQYSVRLPMAMAYAATQHAAQVRKDEQQTPYIGHPMTVTALVLEHGWGDGRFAGEIEDLAIAALLHDVAEDTGGEAKIADIRAMFGARVADVVHAASDSLVADPNEKAPWRTRKEDHIARVSALAALDESGQPRDAGICLVIACDKLHNVTATAAGVAESGEAHLERFSGGIAGTRWYYGAMYQALRPALSPRLSDALRAQLPLVGVSVD
jgi:(p)ppGpp synthase/HD superfamily hydrolase